MLCWGVRAVVVLLKLFKLKTLPQLKNGCADKLAAAVYGLVGIAEIGDIPVYLFFF